MAVIELPPRGNPVTPKRPTIATPVLASEAAEKCISSIDDDLDCVFCIACMLDGTALVPDEAVEALKTLHRRMRRNVDTLYTLG